MSEHGSAASYFEGVDVPRMANKAASVSVIHNVLRLTPTRRRKRHRSTFTLDDCLTRHGGFTLLELLVVVGIIGVLMAILLPTFGKVRRSGKQVECMNNLRQIGTAFSLFAASHKGLLPDPSVSGESWETMLMTNLEPKVLRCGGDEELFPTIGSSYDWRDTGNPRSTLAGRRLSEAPSDTVLAFDCLPGWHGKRKMNAVTVGGGAELMDDVKCLANVSRPMRP